MGPKKNNQVNQANMDKFIDKEVGVGEVANLQEPPEWAKTLLSEVREIRTAITNLNTHVEEKITMVEGKLESTKKQLEEKIEELEFNSRKYNLLLWGLGKTTSEDCQDRVNAFMKSELGFDRDFDMAACHPVRGDTVIIRFVRMCDRESVLKRGSKLKGKKFSLKTDLPPRLRRIRAELRSEAKQRREDGKVVRVVERGKGVYLQEKQGNMWKTL